MKYLLIGGITLSQVIMFCIFSLLQEISERRRRSYLLVSSENVYSINSLKLKEIEMEKILILFLKSSFNILNSSLLF